MVIVLKLENTVCEDMCSLLFRNLKKSYIMWYKNHLQLIATVDTNYKHIVELEALINMLESSTPHYSVSEEQWQRLIMLARNTYWAHYNNENKETVHTELAKLS